jgi:hypothetical protein
MEGYKQANDWARSFIKAMNQARARQRAEKYAARKTAATQEESLLKRLEDFAADFGAEAFENFREQMDRLFGPRKNGTSVDGQATPAGVPSKIEAQSQLKTESDAETRSARGIQSQVGTGNPSPAQVKAVPGTVRDTVDHTKKEQTRSGVPSVPVPQNAVSAAKPAQSQVGTGSSSQPEDPNVGKTMYPDAPLRSPYAIDFVFRLPGSQRRP